MHDTSEPTSISTDVSSLFFKHIGIGLITKSGFILTTNGFFLYPSRCCVSGGVGYVVFVNSCDSDSDAAAGLWGV